MITLTYDDGGLSVNLANAGQATRALFIRWMTDVVRHLHGAVAQNIGSGGLIGRRTGSLARALKDDVTPTPDGAIGTVWPDPELAPYGAIQETGGTITTKKAAALTIPLEAMLTGNGVARGTAAQVKANPQAFGYVATFIPKGHSTIFGKAEDGSTIPLFALKPSVTIPAHNYLDITLRQELGWIADRLERLSGDYVTVAFGGSEAA